MLLVIIVTMIIALFFGQPLIQVLTIGAICQSALVYALTKNQTALRFLHSTGMYCALNLIANSLLSDNSSTLDPTLLEAVRFFGKPSVFGSYCIFIILTVTIIGILDGRRASEIHIKQSL